MRSWLLTLLLALLAYATGLSAALGWKTRDLQQRNSALLHQASTLQAGMYVPAVSLEAIDGHPIMVGDPQPGTRQLLIIFDTRCEFCAASVSAWRELAAVQANGVSIVGLSLDPEHDTARYAAEHLLDFPITAVSDPRIRFTYRLREVPVVSAVEPNGIVSYVRAGRLNQAAALDSVLMALQVSQ
jgi:peroxiredoxin